MSDVDSDIDQDEDAAKETLHGPLVNGRGRCGPSRQLWAIDRRNRCEDILRDLEIVDNKADCTRDKLLKLQHVVTKMQQRSLPSVCSFDKGVLPSTSKRNTTRMFMPDKPQRYGSKNVYDLRFENPELP